MRTIHQQKRQVDCQTQKGNRQCHPTHMDRLSQQKVHSIAGTKHRRN